MPRRRLPHAKKAAFLAAYAETATVKYAAEAAQIDRKTHYRWLASDPEYAEALREAAEEAVERLEREALRRALEGTQKAVYHNGKVVGYVTEYSDTLLIFLLKGARPQKYRDNAQLTYNDNRDQDHSQVLNVITPEQYADALRRMAPLMLEEMEDG